jgi:hypothetical protein
MLDAEQQRVLAQAIQRLAEADRAKLDALRQEVRSLRNSVRPIQPRTVTAISLMATDGGENVVQFDPYLLVPVRVVDSYGKPHFLDVLSPTMDIRQLNETQFEQQTPLGILMSDLGIRSLWELSRFIPHPDTQNELPSRPRWWQVYRDLAEWAVLYQYITRNQFAADTLLVRDGFLRSLIFNGDLFARMWDRIREAVEQHYRRARRRLFVVGVAKRSKVLDRYHLALVMEGVLVQPGARYVRIPPAMEQQVYRWTQYGRLPDENTSEGSGYRVVGALYLAKFGPRRYDPIYPVDVWTYHLERNEVDEVFSYLLADAQVGFPLAYYPLCLQKAHEQANLSGLEGDMLQQCVLDAIRAVMNSDEASALEAFRMQNRRGRRFSYGQ